ncbi:MAG: ankyrin repeat domain-containing protein [Nitrospira sp.]|nr:ankyrin repeat domain-containing protein [Nitrospira sp.]
MACAPQLDVPVWSNGHMTPAMIARIQKRHFLFAFLLLTLYSCHRAPPLHQYARWGSLDHVQFIVNQGDSVNGVDEDGRTALIYAARYGQEEIIRYLLGKGADVNKQAQDGDTPLISASYGCHAKSAEILLAHGADYKVHYQNGWTAFMLAVSQGCTDISAFTRSWFRSQQRDCGRI